MTFMSFPVLQVGKEGVQAILYYSVTDELWRDVIRCVTVTANHDIVICVAAEYKSSFTMLLEMTRYVSMRASMLSVRIFIGTQ